MWLVREKAISQLPRMVDPCDATNDARPSNAPSLGSKTTADFASDGKNLISPSKASFT